MPLRHHQYSLSIFPPSTLYFVLIIPGVVGRQHFILLCNIYSFAASSSRNIFAVASQSVKGGLKVESGNAEEGKWPAEESSLRIIIVILLHVTGQSKSFQVVAFFQQLWCSSSFSSPLVKEDQEAPFTAPKSEIVSSSTRVRQNQQQLSWSARPMVWL